jgi:hypothetical protein
MQKVATRVFISSSVIFGILGILIVLTGTGPDKDAHGYKLVLSKLFMVNIFVILTSFALSVAGKYLKDR